MISPRIRNGFSVFEVMIVAAVLVIIGALVYVALAPKPAKPTAQTSTTTVTIEQVKADQAQLSQENDADLDKELNALTADLNAL